MTTLPRTPASPTPDDSPSGAQHDAAAPWWRYAVIYQIYPRSFADSDGDGIGDLPGIISRLPHLAGLGVDAVWLSPFFVSPQRDAGYDVADYRDVDPLFGTLADAARLVTEAHRAGLRVIVDLVPNHTSSDHAWFQAALAAPPGSPERARYLFRDGLGPDGGQPPNDWRSVFGGPAWTRIPEADGRPGQWYLHLFDATQPDLDWGNPEVREEFLGILRFWLDRGVDGFRVDVAHGLVKAEGLPAWAHEHHLLDLDDVHPDEEAEQNPDNRAGGNPPMWDQEGVHEIYRSWRTLLNSYPDQRMMVAEAWVHPPHRQARYVRQDEMNQAFNFDYVMTPWRAPDLRKTVEAVLDDNAAVGAPATWVLSNHDVVRHGTRYGYDPNWSPQRGIGPRDPQPDVPLGLRRARAATLVMLALPGAAYLYQGEELGLPEHTTLPDELRQDPTWLRTGGQSAGRDGCRVPLPWTTEGPSLGFGPGPGWLPQPPGWAQLSAAAQQGAPGSTLELYRTALTLRRRLQLGLGSLHWLDGTDGGPDAGVLSFRNGSTVVLANLSAAPVPLPPTATVLLASEDVSAGSVPPDVTVWLDVTG